MKKGHLESVYTEKIRKSLKFLGIDSYKIGTPFLRGMPDVYVVSGTWIESKIIPVPKRRNIKGSPVTYFHGPQRYAMDRLSLKGDHVFAAIMWLVDDKTARSMFMPWKTFRHILDWNMATLIHFSEPYNGGAPPQIDQFWNNHKVDLTVFEQRFMEWKFKDLPRHYDTTTTSDFWLYKSGRLVGGEHNPMFISKYEKEMEGII